MILLFIIVGLMSIVMERSFRKGMLKGREEILEENLIRLKLSKPLPENDLVAY